MRIRVIVQDETGNRYGRLLVYERAVRPNPKNAAYWVCRCDCGAVRTVLGSHLRSGATKSCGNHRPVVAVRAQYKRPPRISTKAVEILRTGYNGSDAAFIKPHVYRTPARLDMGPIVAAERLAVELRRTA